MNSQTSEDAHQTEWDMYEITDFLARTLPEGYEPFMAVLSNPLQMQTMGFTYDVQITTDLPERICVDPENQEDATISVFVEQREDGLKATDYGQTTYYWDQICIDDDYRMDQELDLIRQICENYDVSLEVTEGMTSRRFPYQLEVMCEHLSELPDATRRLAEAQSQIGSRDF